MYIKLRCRVGFSMMTSMNLDGARLECNAFYPYQDHARPIADGITLTLLHDSEERPFFIAAMSPGEAKSLHEQLNKAIEFHEQMEAKKRA
ncbi:MAG: hypothetical protein HYS44_00685 [Candidatus Niyogibacteria bacterium]|nr:hypothetical protein [Candidatus Niyogibacteria bacterium]